MLNEYNGFSYNDFATSAWSVDRFEDDQAEKHEISLERNISEMVPGAPYETILATLKPDTLQLQTKRLSAEKTKGQLYAAGGAPRYGHIVNTLASIATTKKQQERKGYIVGEDLALEILGLAGGNLEGKLLIEEDDDVRPATLGEIRAGAAEDVSEKLLLVIAHFAYRGGGDGETLIPVARDRRFTKTFSREILDAFPTLDPYSAPPLMDALLEELLSTRSDIRGRWGHLVRYANADLSIDANRQTRASEW